MTRWRDSALGARATPSPDASGWLTCASRRTSPRVRSHGWQFDRRWRSGPRAFDGLDRTRRSRALVHAIAGRSSLAPVTTATRHLSCAANRRARQSNDRQAAHHHRLWTWRVTGRSLCGRAHRIPSDLFLVEGEPRRRVTRINEAWLEDQIVAPIREIRYTAPTARRFKAG